MMESAAERKALVPTKDTSSTQKALIHKKNGQKLPIPKSDPRFVLLIP